MYKPDTKTTLYLVTA